MCIYNFQKKFKAENDKKKIPLRKRTCGSDSGETGNSHLSKRTYVVDKEREQGCFGTW